MAIDLNKLKALITLLDDPDEEIFQTVKKNLLDAGSEVIPELEKAWENSLNSKMHDRIEDIIQVIQFKIVKESIFKWSKIRDNNLLEGVYYIAKYQYPDLKIEDLNKHIDVIKKDAWLELNENLTALEKVKILNHIFFDVHNFALNNSNFYSPQNSYINTVIESKKGNPLTLSILYSIVAQSLNIPIYGVNLPKNFILAYKEEVSAFLAFPETGDTVLFYINPANKGAVFGRKEIDVFLKQQKIEPEKSYYLPCSNIEIVQRLVVNLITAYEKLGYTDKINDLHEIQNLLIE